MKTLPVIASEAKQSGFGLLELMLATTIAAGITLGYLYNQSRQSAINQAQSQAGYYQMVSDAVAKYMAINYDQLQAIPKPKTCSEPRLFTDATAAPSPTGCGIQALFLSGSTSSPVANGLQPTLTELKTTGYLDANFSNSFLWPTQLTMYAASGVKTGSSYAAPEYRVQIQAWCNGAAPSSNTVCDNPVLHSLVYNAQPFADSTSNSFINFTRLDKLLQARTALGANAFISYDWALQKDKLIYSEGNKNQLPNLLKFTSGSDSGVGVQGVLALQATYMPVQVSGSPTPPPTPTPPYPSEIPFSACDASQENMVAISSSSIQRLIPVPPWAWTSGYYPTCNTNFSVPGNTFFRRRTAGVWAFSNDVMQCKRNISAPDSPSTNGFPCPIPPSWKKCVTAVKNGEVTKSNQRLKGSSYPEYPWVFDTPANDAGEYCWQPITETFWFVGELGYSNYPAGGEYGSLSINFSYFCPNISSSGNWETCLIISPISKGWGHLYAN